MSWLRRQTKRSVLVALTDGETSVKGLLRTVARDGIVLTATVLLSPGGEISPMSGDVHIPRGQIRFVQFPVVVAEIRA